MKMALRLCSWLLALTCLLGFSITVSAKGHKKYETIKVFDEERDRFLCGIQFEQIDKEVSSNPFTYFAISENGLIALCCDTEDIAVIHVYRADGQFLYGYRFKADALSMFFEGENLSIYWFKRSYLGTFDPEGNCLRFRKALTIDRGDEAYDGVICQPTNGRVGNIQYQAKLGFGPIPTYTRFVVENSDGSIQVIYDVTKEYHTQCVIKGVALLFCVAFVVFVMVSNKKAAIRPEHSMEDNDNKR